jgi:hypothetical protein
MFWAHTMPDANGPLREAYRLCHLPKAFPNRHIGSGRHLYEVRDLLADLPDFSLTIQRVEFNHAIFTIDDFVFSGGTHLGT